MREENNDSIAGNRDIYKKEKISCKPLIYKRFNRVRPSIEMLNLWEDFHKVVKFIDDNFEWLNPLMERITKKKLSLD